MIPLAGNKSGAGALSKASSRFRVTVASIGSFRRCVAQLSASCWVEKVSPEANPEDGPSGQKPVRFQMAKMVLKLRRVPGGDNLVFLGKSYDPGAARLVGTAGSTNSH